jgi:hypothetical protein
MARALSGLSFPGIEVRDRIIGGGNVGNRGGRPRGGIGDWGGNYATGGSFIASKPTLIEVGEGGESEVVTITPMSQLRSGMANIGTSSSAMSYPVGYAAKDGGSENKIVLEMYLSPDLEARVVSTTLGEAADVFMDIIRSR